MYRPRLSAIANFRCAFLSSGMAMTFADSSVFLRVSETVPVIVLVWEWHKKETNNNVSNVVCFKNIK
jgi:phosphomannomutase